MDVRTLHEIDEELVKSEVAALKFLCTDFVGRKRLETVKDAKDLFQRLDEQDSLGEGHLLAELLYTIGRYDLLVSLGTSKAEVRKRLQDRRDSGSGVSSYRKMLYELSEAITNENLHAMKFLLNGLPRAKIGESATFLDVVAEMEKMQLLCEDNLDELQNVLENCDKQLTSKVEDFKKRHSTRKQTDSCESNMVITDAEESSTIDLPEKLTDVYPLTRRPRGWCLIINNYNFKKCKLPNRPGTNRDAEDLSELFSKMYFVLKVNTDLCSSEMRALAQEFAAKDHSQMDAFICCVLSHGGKGTVFGTDGIEVSIRDLTLPFARCPTLLGKPKVFFIQACQGDLYQRGMYIQEDSGVNRCEDTYEADARSVALSSIPIEADFLIGMATVEQYKSFRHVSNGSIFIQALCKQLNLGLRSKDDILSIMTKVNRDVSTQMLLGHKQMPEPRYTLTKKLVFTLD
ncbi:caspase-8 [Electrophorus electricus]|uniref:Caspase-8 n=1 Tax=Electrophorus electricus TaxID=8005 RepID=A0A4W4H0K2_ELEEL|nr:caspase-8 [Electrophorus electricus]